MRRTGVSCRRGTVSWSPDGSSFRVHDCDRFMSDVASKYFKMTMYRSFVSPCASKKIQELRSPTYILTRLFRAHDKRLVR